MNKKSAILLVIVVLLLTTLACRVSFQMPEFLSEKNVSREDVSPPFSTPTAAPPVIMSPDAAGNLLGLEALLIELYERVSPGVVAIRTLGPGGGGLGSGIVYSEEGHIVTNYHVVENAAELEIHFVSGYKVRGKVIGTDIDSDLAVIKVDAPPGELFPLALGDSEALQIGQLVVAIGNPFGLSGTMTMGIVSAKGRTLDSLRPASQGAFFSAGDIIQTDASINPGNSGGPLLNLNGQVIGINRAIRATGITPAGEPLNTGIGFAVSVNIVKRVVPVLIETGSFEYPYLGITARPELTLTEQELLGLSQSVGAYVISVEPGSPADQAGLRGGKRTTQIPEVMAGGDLITAVDDHPVFTFGDLLSYLMLNKSPGEDVVLTILRNNQEMEVTVTLGKRP